MTVELVQGEPGNGPFVWPKEPDDMSPWGKKNADQLIEDIKQERKDRAGRSSKWPKDAGTLARKARQIVGKIRKEDERRKSADGDGQEEALGAVT